MAMRLSPLLIPILFAAGTAVPTAAAQDAAAPATADTAQADAPASATADPGVDQALAGAWRSPENRARDQYRHPRETLDFFGIRPGQTVVEISPGGGWYAEILAPLLGEGYVGAVVDPAAYPEGRSRDYYAGARRGLETLFAANPEPFSRARVVAFDPKAPVFGPAGSADAVLTFRNVHNWRSAGTAEAMFQGFFDVLRPGGVLGVVEHRAAADVAEDDRSGYVGQDQVIALATAAGFRLDAASEINANPRDTRDHPNGVWTLPPTNRHDAEDRQRYQAIGESDRMTLRFIKP